MLIPTTTLLHASVAPNQPHVSRSLALLDPKAVLHLCMGRQQSSVHSKQALLLPVNSFQTVLKLTSRQWQSVNTHYQELLTPITSGWTPYHGCCRWGWGTAWPWAVAWWLPRGSMELGHPPQLCPLPLWGGVCRPGVLCMTSSLCYATGMPFLEMGFACCKAVLPPVLKGGVLWGVGNGLLRNS